MIVNDIDWIIPDVLLHSHSGDVRCLPATQNVTLILNIIDSLAGDERFINIRKRTRDHRTLVKIDESTQKYRDEARNKGKEFTTEFEKEIEDTRKRFQENIDAVDKIPGLSRTAREQMEERVRRRENDRLEAQLVSIENTRNRKIKQIDYAEKQEIRGVQEDLYKLYAILVPPIPPLLLALYVFFRRRGAEQGGIAKTRLR